MPIVTISRGTFSGGRTLAEELARKLGCECAESEVLGDAARQFGVPVSRLKAAMVKAPAALRGFAREREMYLACITAALGERALSGNLVYHGHAAHLLLPGVSHVLRVRVMADLEFRVKAAMARMNLNRVQAKKYVGSVDADRARWVDFLYGIDWTDPSHYDLVINLEHISVSNAAAALCAMAELPEFKPTPASTQQLNDLLLASRARVRLGVDPRTARADVIVKAHQGILSVTHLPQQAQVAPLIPAVLEGLEGVKEIHTAIASTTLLWMEEEFSPTSEAFAQVAEIAQRWDAAVELLKVSTEETDTVARTVALGGAAVYRSEAEEDGGVIFDADDTAGIEGPTKTDDVTSSLDALLAMGRAGQGRVVAADRLPMVLDPATKYALVVVGNVFRSKPDMVRGRLARELRAAVADHLGVPVVGLDEIRQRLRFGPREYGWLVVGLALVVAVYFVIFSYQEPILRFLVTGVTVPRRIMAVVALLLGIPTFAFLYGSCVNLVTKLFRFD